MKDSGGLNDTPIALCLDTNDDSARIERTGENTKILNEAYPRAPLIQRIEYNSITAALLAFSIVPLVFIENIVARSILLGLVTYYGGVIWYTRPKART